MGFKIEQPGPGVRQVSGKDPSGRFVLSVIVRKTYQISSNGQCVPSEKPLPLQIEPLFDPKDPERLVLETDLFPYKPRTDVVVKGHAYAYSQERQFHAEVRVGDAAKRILVVGDRRCTRSAGGGLVFSAPAAVEKIPLAYTHAYGGRDKAAEAAALENHEKKSLPIDFAPKGINSPYLYPRNPSGRGYLIKADPGAVEALALPNLEDPLDPLTPARLPSGAQLMWPRLPLPQATDWVAYAWFPRISGVGMAPLHDRSAHPFAEITRGLVPQAVIQPPSPDAIDAFHLACGASLGLQFPYLRGGEIVTLEHIHPKQALFRFALPNERLKIWTDGRKGKFNKTDPVIHTVLIEPDESRVSIVWRGSAPALRPYMPQELEKMPLRVEW